MVNYQHGKIYAIRSHQTDKVYIGSTTQNLAMRMGGHRKDYKLYLNGKCRFVTSFKILEYGDAYIELIEACPCNSKAELERREGQLIRETDNTVNKLIAGRTPKQYRQDNREKILEQKKQYYQDNLEKILEQLKQYRQDNREKILEQKKQYYQNNQKKIAEYKKHKCKCKCEGKYMRANKARHFRSKKHQKYIQTCNQMAREIKQMNELNDRLNRESEALDRQAIDIGLM